MKKTVLALSVIASFSTFAADDFNVRVTEINKQIKEHGLTVDSKGMVTDSRGNYVADATYDNGRIRLEQTKDGKVFDIDVETGSGIYIEDGYMANVVVVDDTNWKPNNDVIANTVRASEIFDSVGRIDTKEDEFGRHAIYGKDGDYIGGAISGDGYTVITNEKTGDTVRINEKTGEYTYWDADNNESKGYIDNDVTIDPVNPVNPNNGKKPTPVDPVNPIKPDPVKPIKPAVEGVVKTTDLIELKKQGIETQVDAKGNAVFVKGGETVAVAVKDGHGNYQVVDATTGERSTVKYEENTVAPVNPQDPSKVIDRVTKELNIKEEREGVYSINKGEHAGTRINSNTGEVTNVRGEKIGQIKVDDAGNVIVDERSGNTDTPVKPSNNVIDEASKAISDEVNSRIEQASRSASATADSNSKRIDSLEQSMIQMGNKMLVLEERMDGVVASSHAINNARPVLSSAGQYGVGVGIGGAGSKQAIAIGGAMQFSENWSGSMSVNYETKGKLSSDQLSAGVGAQYVF